MWQCHLWLCWGVNHGGGGEGRQPSSRRLQINGNYHLDTSTLITEQDQGQGGLSLAGRGALDRYPGNNGSPGPQIGLLPLNKPLTAARVTA